MVIEINLLLKNKNELFINFKIKFLVRQNIEK
jgi:hypothetical protein